MKVVLTGATGFIGKAFALDCIRNGQELVALVRNPKRVADLPCKAVRWSAEEPDTSAIENALAGADAVVNLAGEPVGEGRWSAETKRRILESRTLGTQALVRALARLPKEKRPKILINASAIGLYGDRADATLTEDSAPGSGFLSEVVRAWEHEALAAQSLGIRVVLMRLGVVLGAEGGALQKMKSVVLGSGRQWMSWVHSKDVVSFMQFAMKKAEMSGAYNLVAPNPLRNEDFTRHLARALGSLTTLKAPGWIIKSVLGEMSQIVLSSAQVLPRRTLEAGFQFAYPTLESALEEIYPSTHRGDRSFKASQFIARPVEEVFSYFTRAENLEEITPPWLGFHIVAKSTPELGESTLIEYKLKIHGLPVRWKTRIDSWRPNRQFVDTQLKGPYAKWHHTHTFESVPGGTIIHDEVHYRLPLGSIGNALAGAFVKKDVEQIFSYRKGRIGEVFKP